MVSTISSVNVSEISVFMTEQLAFKTTKRKDRANEEGWFQNGPRKTNKAVG